MVTVIPFSPMRLLDLPPDEDVAGVESLNGLTGNVRIIDESGDSYSTDDSCIIIPRASDGVDHLNEMESDIEIKGGNKITVRNEEQKIIISFDSNAESEDDSDNDDKKDCKDPSGGGSVNPSTGNTTGGSGKAADGYHTIGGGGVSGGGGGGAAGGSGGGGGGAGGCDC